MFKIMSEINEVLDIFFSHPLCRFFVIPFAIIFLLNVVRKILFRFSHPTRFLFLKRHNIFLKDDNGKGKFGKDI